MTNPTVSLEQAAKLLEDFGVGPALTTRIAALEVKGQGASSTEIKRLLQDEALDANMLAAARTVKAMAGQI